MNLETAFDARALARRLAAIILALDAAYVLSQILVFGFGWRPNSLALAAVDLNREWSLPSLFSGAQLLLAAALLGRTASVERGRARPWAAWAGLCAAFVFLSADETFAIHEMLNAPLRASLHTAGGALHHAWVVPYLVLTAALGALYIPFLRRLPARDRNLFVLAGAIFVGGAVGCELVGGWLQAGSTVKTIPVVVEILVEETMEMGGIALFVFGLARRLSEASDGKS